MEMRHSPSGVAPLSLTTTIISIMTAASQEWDPDLPSYSLNDVIQAHQTYPRYLSLSLNNVLTRCSELPLLISMGSNQERSRRGPVNLKRDQS